MLSNCEYAEFSGKIPVISGGCEKMSGDFSQCVKNECAVDMCAF